MPSFIQWLSYLDLRYFVEVCRGATEGSGLRDAVASGASAAEFRNGANDRYPPVPASVKLKVGC